MFTRSASGSQQAIIYGNDCTPDDSIIGLFGVGNAFAIVQPDSVDSRRIISASLDELANKALACWPDWYEDGGFAEGAENSYDARFITLSAIAKSCRDNRRINPTWLRKATALAARGQPPCIDGLAYELQAAQLSLLLAGRVEALVLKFSPSHAAFNYVGGIVKAAEWLARETRLPLFVTIPQILTEREELAPLLMDSLVWPCSGSVPENRRQAENPNDPAEKVQRPSKNTSAGTPDTLDDVAGKPHHNSPGELLLAEYLPRDSRLKGLFCFNQPVVTKNEMIHRVDLLWREGKMVIEVDGYQNHIAEAQFTKDRHRDYDLQISGYTVIRLTSKEILRDPVLAMERIHEFVAYLRNK